MIVIIDVNENMTSSNHTYVQNVDAAIEKIFQNDMEGIVLTDSVCDTEIARLKAIVNALDEDILIVKKESTVDEAIQKIQQTLLLQRMSNVTFSDVVSSPVISTYKN